MTTLTDVMANPREWWIELSPTLLEQCWRQSQRQSQPGRRWDAYLGRLCMQGLLPWLQEIEIFSSVETKLSHSDWPAIWDLFGGYAMQVEASDEHQKSSPIPLVIIPNNELEAQDLVVPQEWVDLPHWSGQYYLAVQLHDEDEPSEQHLPKRSWLRVWGYTDHHSLKQLGHYDPRLRTYTLSAPHLTTDMTTLGVTLRYCDAQVQQTAATPSLEFSEARQEALLEQLSHPELILPRLAIPFSQWGALIQAPDWRQRLYERRCRSLRGQLDRQVTRLSNWLEGQCDAGWRSLEELLGPELAFSPQLRSSINSHQLTSEGKATGQQPVRRAKRIKLNQGQDSISLVLILWVTPELSDSDALSSRDRPQLKVHAQLHPLEANTLPEGVSLWLQATESPESGEYEMLQKLQSGSADTYLQLTPFIGEAGEHFQLRITSSGESADSSHAFSEAFCL